MLLIVKPQRYRKIYHRYFIVYHKRLHTLFTGILDRIIDKVAWLSRWYFPEHYNKQQKVVMLLGTYEKATTQIFKYLINPA